MSLPVAFVGRPRDVVQGWTGVELLLTGDEPLAAFDGGTFLAPVLLSPAPFTII